MMNHGSSRPKNYSLYPSNNIEDNFLVYNATSLLLFFVGCLTFPLKFFLRKNFGARYFTPLNLLFYFGILCITLSLIFIYVLVHPYAIYMVIFSSDDFYQWFTNIVFLTNLPLFSLTFIVIVCIGVFRYLKSSKDVISKASKYSFYCGESKYFQNLIGHSFNGKKITEEIIRSEIEPLFIATIAIISLMLDPLLGLYLMFASLLLKFEIWQEHWQREKLAWDIRDQIIDGQYYQYMVQKYQEHEYTEEDFKQFAELVLKQKQKPPLPENRSIETLQEHNLIHPQSS